MLYRIRVDLKFPQKSDSDEVWTALRGYLNNKDIRNLAEETSYIEYHECYHDEGKPCLSIERFEKV